MKYSKEMELFSESGYCMPFEERDKDVEMTLGYGKQTHPATGQEFFHHGIDFNVHLYLLSAVASGKVTGIGTENVHGTYITVTYGRYEVTYSHLSTVTTAFGKHVRAGQVIAISGELLHMEVRYKGEELNPVEFLSMLYANLKSTQASPDGMEFVTMDIPVETDFEKDRDEIESLLERYFPAYMDDMRRGLYMVPEHTELSLRNIFTLAASKDCFYESIPSMANPLGIGRKAMPMAVKAQNLLISDFLNYLALRHGIYLSSLTADEKKKLAGG